MSDIESTSPKPADSGALLGTLLSNPDLIRNISAMLGKSGDGATEEASPQPTNLPPLGNNEAVTDGISRVLSNPEMMAKLPDVMKMIAPMMQQTQSSQGASVPASATPSHGGGHDRRGCRNDLLIALKPFLSPERCRAIDMLLGLSRLGDVLQKMI
ncbi:MAG: hypothetical protein E7584_02815 [Ruminococcaceae bacterium]|nr:hypothetical protein [Oscillospiraceae bacterium]